MCPAWGVDNGVRGLGVRGAEGFCGDPGGRGTEGVWEDWAVDAGWTCPALGLGASFPSSSFGSWDWDHLGWGLWGQISPQWARLGPNASSRDKPSPCHPEGELSTTGGAQTPGVVGTPSTHTLPRSPTKGTLMPHQG